jgi:hypothetical protein
MVKTLAMDELERRTLGSIAPEAYFPAQILVV